MVVVERAVHGPSTLVTHPFHLGNPNVISAATPDLPPRPTFVASRSDSTQHHYEIDCVRDGKEVSNCSHVGEKYFLVSLQVSRSHDHHVDE